VFVSGARGGEGHTKLTSFPPTVALSGGWSVGGGNYLQAFVNSFAVGDDQLNLSVGGQMTVEDSAKNEKGAMRGADPFVKGYKLGFLYTPTKESLYSVIYTPDEDSNGMEYSFTAFRRMSEQCSLAVRAEGKVIRS